MVAEKESVGPIVPWRQSTEMGRCALLATATESLPGELWCCPRVCCALDL